MRKQIEIPKNCPSCGSILELVNLQLFCRNIMCPARATKGLEHFAKVLSIKGLGPETIKKLGIAHYIELYDLTEDSLATKLGSEKIAKKLIEQINKSIDSEFCSIITAFGIPEVGKTTAAKLSSLNSIEDITFDRCKSLGLGNVASTNLMEFINNDFQEIKHFLPFPKLFNNIHSKEESVALTKPVVCITGKLKSFKTKEEAKEALESKGYTVVDNLTKKVNILIDEENRNSSKRVKALEMGIEIVENLLTLIKEENL